MKEGSATIDVFGFLTADLTKEVGPIHPKAMPVVLTKPEECDLWMRALLEEAMKLQRPLADNALVIVA